MNSHSAWFENVYGESKCKRILIIPTKKLSCHADFTHPVEIMRKKTRTRLKQNVRNFFKEFIKYVLHEVSDQKIQQLIDIHDLDIPSFMDKYSEKYHHQKS